MDFRELTYVLAIARHQNITKAAEALYVGQPTLSKSNFFPVWRNRWGSDSLNVLAENTFPPMQAGVISKKQRG